jgi:hypothetical protein
MDGRTDGRTLLRNRCLREPAVIRVLNITQTWGRPPCTAAQVGHGEVLDDMADHPSVIRPRPLPRCPSAPLPCLSHIWSCDDAWQVTVPPTSASDTVSPPYRSNHQDAHHHQDLQARSSLSVHQRHDDSDQELAQHDDALPPRIPARRRRQQRFSAAAAGDNPKRTRVIRRDVNKRDAGRRIAEHAPT